MNTSLMPSKVSMNSRSSLGFSLISNSSRAFPDDQAISQLRLVVLGDHAAERTGGLPSPVGRDVENAPARRLDVHAEQRAGDDVGSSQQQLLDDRGFADAVRPAHHQRLALRPGGAVVVAPVPRDLGRDGEGERRAVDRALPLSLLAHRFHKPRSELVAHRLVVADRPVRVGADGYVPVRCRQNRLDLGHVRLVARLRHVRVKSRATTRSRRPRLYPAVLEARLDFGGVDTEQVPCGRRA